MPNSIKQNFEYYPNELIHTMVIRYRQDHCPVGQHVCVCVGNKGRIIYKCKNARITNENAESIIFTKDGFSVGARCQPYQSINFITED